MGIRHPLTFLEPLAHTGPDGGIVTSLQSPGIPQGWPMAPLKSSLLSPPPTVALHLVDVTI